MPGTLRIFAGVSGSPGSVHALRQAAQAAQRVSARTAYAAPGTATGQANKEGNGHEQAPGR